MLEKRTGLCTRETISKLEKIAKYFGYEDIEALLESASRGLDKMGKGGKMLECMTIRMMR